MHTEKGKGYFITLTENDVIDYLLSLSGDKINENDELVINNIEWVDRKLFIDIDTLRRFDA